MTGILPDGTVRSSSLKMMGSARQSRMMGSVELATTMPATRRRISEVVEELDATLVMIQGTTGSINGTRWTRMV